MYFKPHKLYKIVIQPLQEDENGNPIPNTNETEEYIGGCFLHDMTTELLKGFAGTGINPKHYIVAERVDNIKAGDTVRVLECDLVRGEGKVLQVQRTSLLGNYIKIFI